MILGGGQLDASAVRGHNFVQAHHGHGGTQVINSKSEFRIRAVGEPSGPRPLGGSQVVFCLLMAVLLGGGVTVYWITAPERRVRRYRARVLDETGSQRDAARELGRELARQGPEVVPAVTRLLYEDHKAVQQAALEVLARIDHPEALDSLRLAVRSSYPEVRLAAARLLDERGTAPPWDLLQVVATADDVPVGLRVKAIRMLPATGADRIYEVLQDLLEEDRDPRIHTAALGSISEIFERLSPPDQHFARVDFRYVVQRDQPEHYYHIEVRVQAIRLLARHGLLTRPVDTLAKLMGDSDPRISRAAAEGICEQYALRRGDPEWRQIYTEIRDWPSDQDLPKVKIEAVRKRLRRITTHQVRARPWAQH